VALKPHGGHSSGLWAQAWRRPCGYAQAVISAHREQASPLATAAATTLATFFWVLRARERQVRRCWAAQAQATVLGGHRPQRPSANDPADPDATPHSIGDVDAARLRGADRLGGLIHECRMVA
jgi:hypothetical protein